VGPGCYEVRSQFDRFDSNSRIFIRLDMNVDRKVNRSMDIGGGLDIKRSMEKSNREKR